MNFAWSEEQQDVRELARRILKDLVNDDIVTQAERDGQPYLKDAWAALSEAELMSLSLSEEAGGGGMGEEELSILLREIGAVGAPLPVMSTLVLAALPLDKFGNDAQKKRAITALAATPEIVGAWSEIARRDLYQPATTLTKNDDGSYTLNGVKTHVEAAKDAKAFVVTAQLDGKPVLLIAPNGDGVTVSAQDVTNWTIAYEVRFENVAINEEDIIVQGDAATDALDYLIDRLLMAQSSLMLGLADTTLKLTATHAVDRVQFGQPIATFQAVGQRCADAYIDLQALELAVLRVAWLQANDHPSTDAAQKAKFVAAQTSHRIGATATHIHGGIGFDRDYPLYRYFLGLKVLEFSFGNANEQLQKIGQRFAQAATPEQKAS